MSKGIPSEDYHSGNLLNDATVASSYFTLNYSPYDYYEREGYGVQRERGTDVDIANRCQHAIYFLCGRKAEPLVVNYPTGIRHQRLFTLQRYMPYAPYRGTWMPLTDVLRYIALPRLRPQEEVIAQMKLGVGESDTRSVTDLWADWAERYGSELDYGINVDESSSAEEIYEYLMSPFVGRFTLEKPSHHMKQLTSKRRESAPYNDYDLVIPTSGITDTTTIQDTGFGFFNLWLDLAYYEATYRDAYGEPESWSTIKAQLRGLDNAIFRKLLAGLSCLFIPPLMYQMSEYEIGDKSQFKEVKTPLQTETGDRVILRFPPVHSPIMNGRFSPLWFFMTALRHYIPTYQEDTIIEPVKEEMFEKDRSFSLGENSAIIQDYDTTFVATLREDMTLDDIYHLRFHKFVPPSKDDGEMPQVPIRAYNISSQGGYTQEVEDKILTNIFALGGYAQLTSDSYPFHLGLGTWTQSWAKVEYHHYTSDEKVRKRKWQQVRPATYDGLNNQTYRDENVSNPLDASQMISNPTPLSLRGREIKSSFVFIPDRPLQGAFGVLNWRILP